MYTDFSEASCGTGYYTKRIMVSVAQIHFICVLEYEKLYFSCQNYAAQCIE